MCSRANIQAGAAGRSRAAVALLPCLAVLAVLAILAAFLIPALLRDIDYDVSRQESATLKTFGNALLAAVQRNDYIPCETNWAQFVATEAGWNLPAVATNPRRQPRLLLIDTSGWFTNVSLPYIQTYLGVAQRPLNARMIIASSLGAPLPLAAGPLSPSEFSALWKAGEGTTNFPATGLWAGWKGRSEDVKLERVEFSPLFVALRAVTYLRPAPQGLYSVGTNTVIYPAPYRDDATPPPPAYLLQGTLVRLYNAAGNLDSTQILLRDGSFIYKDGIWKSSEAGGAMPGGVDLAGVVYSFLNCPPNLNAQNGALQQKLVVQSMMNYMSNYNVWAAGNFSDNGLKTYLLNTVQPNMISTIQGLFQGAYYPVNPSSP